MHGKPMKIICVLSPLITKGGKGIIPKPYMTQEGCLIFIVRGDNLPFLTYICITETCLIVHLFPFCFHETLHNNDISVENIDW